jgi:VIT1/CCC1 family predicted Fe2+/Mn2+ transporter
MRVIEIQHGVGVASTQERSIAETRRAWWKAACVAAFLSSGLSFLLGAGISLFAALAFLPPSKASAYATVGLLFASFVFAFLGAHALDKLDAIESD